jgi:diacylglycerol kinase (ATP)
MRIRLIVHSSDDAALARLRSAVERMRSQGHDVVGLVTFEAGDAERFAHEATAAGVDLILAAGGDGTLNEVVNGIFSAAAGKSAEELPALGIIPLGTANDLANTLEVPVDIDAAVAHALRGQQRKVDVARINDRYFLNVSTGGLGAEATEEAPERAKRVIGVFAYLAQGVRKFASLTPSTARFTTAGEVVYDGDFLLFAVGNGRRTGGGNWLTPRAEMDDGLLDLCIVLPTSHGEFLRLLPDLRSGGHLEHDRIIYRQLPSIEIQATGPANLSVNADGEPLEYRTFRYTVEAGALRVCG